MDQDELIQKVIEHDVDIHYLKGVNQEQNERLDKVQRSCYEICRKMDKQVIVLLTAILASVLANILINSFIK